MIKSRTVVPLVGEERGDGYETSSLPNCLPSIDTRASSASMEGGEEKTLKKPWPMRLRHTGLPKIDTGGEGLSTSLLPS